MFIKWNLFNGLERMEAYMNKTNAIKKQINENAGYELIKWVQKEKIMRLTLDASVCELLNSLKNSGDLEEIQPIVEIHYFKEGGKGTYRKNAFFYETFVRMTGSKSATLIDQGTMFGEELDKGKFKSEILKKVVKLVENNDDCWIESLQALEKTPITEFLKTYTK